MWNIVTHENSPSSLWFAFQTHYKNYIKNFWPTNLTQFLCSPSFADQLATDEPDAHVPWKNWGFRPAQTAPGLFSRVSLCTPARGQNRPSIMLKQTITDHFFHNMFQQHVSIPMLSCSTFFKLQAQHISNRSGVFKAFGPQSRQPPPRPASKARMREECVDYMVANREDFEPFIDEPWHRWRVKLFGFVFLSPCLATEVVGRFGFA